MVYFANEPAEQPSLRSSRVPRSGFFLFRQMKIVQSFILKLKDHTAKRPYQVAYLSLPNFSTWHCYYKSPILMPPDRALILVARDKPPIRRIGRCNS